MVGINCAGINSKWQSFNKIIHDLKPCAFFLQETKLPHKQQFKSDTSNYIIFRLERELSGGGGLALGVIQDLNPILIRCGNDATEAISVKINVKTFEMRLVVGYGAQENDRQAKLHNMSQNERKQLMWNFIEEETKEAERLEQGIVVQIDSNAHLGPEQIKKDPNPINENGKMFAKFMKQNPGLSVVNSLNICKGLITRRRETITGVQEAVLDLFLVNQRMIPYLKQMTVDEDEEYILTNFAQKKQTNPTKQSDHRPVMLELNMEFNKIKPDRVENFNFKSEICQNTFRNITDTETALLECFKNDFSPHKQARLWQKAMENVFHKAFTKVRVKNSFKKSSSTESKLIEERRLLIRKLGRSSTSNAETSQRIEEIENELCDKNIQVISSKVKAQLISAAEQDSTHGTTTSWSIYRKMRPKHKPVIPVGKKDKNGEIITNQTQLKNLYLETFIWRLRTRPSKPSMLKIHKLKESMFQQILKLCKMRPSTLWTMQELEIVLKSLKKDKCRDPHGLVNEIFSTNIAGKFLKQSMLALFNGIKISHEIPNFMKIADISAIYKGKGSMNELKNERGIFIVTIYRTILMKLLYNEKVDIIEKHMSESQIGARKEKNIRNHIWVVNAVISDVLKSKTNKPIDIQIRDVRQCFDGLWPEDCLNDLFSYGVQDNSIPLLYNGCQDNVVKIRTPVGNSETTQIKSTFMQGDVWSSKVCSVHIDSIGKECIEEHKYLYQYKGTVPIPPMAMVDDLLCISECGPASVQMSSYINYKAASKKLQWGTDKCNKMQVGKAHSNDTCPELAVDGWKEVVVKHIETGEMKIKDIYEGEDVLQIKQSEKYLGDIISDDGKNTQNIQARVNRGRGIAKDLNATIVSIFANSDNF